MRYVIVLLLILAFSTDSFALTDQQLKDAEDTLAQMMGTISRLGLLIGTARRGKAGIFFDLTPEQKQALINQYLSEKSELVTLYNQLP